MNLVIMQPYFFPYVGYMSLIAAADTFVIYDDVNYINRGWINRNNFLASNGSQLFTLPVSKASQNRRICDLTLHDMNKAKTQFLAMLTRAYAKAPHFNEVMDLLATTFSCEDTNLSVFLTHTLDMLIQYLGLPCRLVRSVDRSLSQELAGEARIIEIAKTFGATRYINAIGGTSLYHQKKFMAEGIELCFLKHLGTNYPQFSTTHLPSLSIIDVLMFNSVPDAVRIIKNYELVHG